MTDAMNVDSSVVLGGLKSFQRRTVDYVFQRLWTDNNPTHRFLVADEVGLGKTMVARGVIAQTIEHLRELRVPRIDIVYICSNAEIARQNIARLNVTGRSDFVQATRLTMLPELVSGLKENPLNFISFTPGTSFDMGGRAIGAAAERVVLFRLLEEAWALDRRSGTINVFRGDVRTVDSFRARIEAREETKLDDGLKRAFETAVASEPDLERLFRELESEAPRANSILTKEYYARRKQLISRLRRILARVCIEALEPDLVILDEFQRFKHLISGDDATESSEQDARELARALFEYESQDAHGKTRVLLLSATPYRMYTQTTDAGDDDHYKDFLTTLGFLKGNDSLVTPIKTALGELRSSLLSTGSPDERDFRPAKRLLEDELRGVMVRTERLAASADRNGMLKEVPMAGITVTPSDVLAHHETQRVARLLSHPDVTEYWKAAPYIGTFGGGYKLGDLLQESDDDSVGEHIARARHLLVPRDVREGFKKLEPPHPRLRWLVEELERDGLFELPWLPPSLPYYELQGVFRGREGKVTKRLVFSAWQMVPKAIAALISLEAERRAFGSRAGETLSRAVDATTVPLSFSTRDGEPSRMAFTSLLYPSVALAALGDPLTAMRGGVHRPTMEDVKRVVQGTITAALGPLLASAPTEGREDDRWFWASSVLLDALENRDVTRTWFDRGDVGAPWTASSDSEEPGRSVDLYVRALSQFADGQIGDLGRPPANLAEVLTTLALGSPAVCALRSLTRGREDSRSRVDVRDAAAFVAGGFRSYFNAPVMVKGIRAADDDAYWQAVAHVGADGCLQAVMDEWAHVIPESLGVADAPDDAETYQTLAEAMREALTLRAGSITSLKLNKAGDTPKPFRSRMAARFGDQQVSDSETMRATTVRSAFNSPFWPFVLASTSVGQEGLDFHQYCHAIIHWNLPHNPVDLEQREGRVHRYKGHAVRRNAAQLHGAEVLKAGASDPWRALFDRALEVHGDGSDIVPFWVLPAEGGAKIERHVPSLPLSREAGRLDALRRSLVMYRMVFGQPRQDELVKYLEKRLSDEDVVRTVADLRIDLTPPIRAIGRSDV